MSFSKTSRKIRLSDGWLLNAECLTNSGVYKQSTVDLRDWLGVVDGRFAFAGKLRFLYHTRDERLYGTILQADVPGFNSVYQRDYIDLDDVIANDGGKLVPWTGCHVCSSEWQKSWPILERAICLTLPLSHLLDPSVSCSLCCVLSSVVRSCWPASMLHELRAESVAVKFAVDKALEISLPGFAESEAVRRVWNSEGLYHPHLAIRMLRSRMRGSVHLDETAAKLRNWVEGCRKHEACTKRDYSKVTLPRRILDVGRYARDPIRLKSDQGEPGKYACLSYCWGGVVPLTLTQDTLSKFQLGIDWDELPRTFQDAIQICRALSTQYLWIDSLCILQDSMVDWRAESTRMADYYGRCFVCLAASQGSNSMAPLSPPQYSSSLAEIKGTTFGGAPYRLLVSKYFDNFFHSDDELYSTGPTANRWPHPLATRAWAYQERVLSPRVAHFGASEVIFECQTGFVCECNRIQKRDSASARNAVLINTGFVGFHDEIFGASLKTAMHDYVDRIEEPTGPGDPWWSVVTEYSNLKITSPRDRLPALSGLAHAYRSGLKTLGMPPGRYLAGLWERSVLDDLGWRATGPLSPRLHSDPTPSWSWARVNGPVEYSHKDLIIRGHCKALSATTRGENAKDLGEVTSGTILLSGHLCSVNWSMHSLSRRVILSPVDDATFLASPSTQPTDSARSESCIKNDEQTTSLDYDISAPGEWQVPESKALFVLVLREVDPRKARLECLLLDHVDEYTYQRVGFTSFLRSELQVIKIWPMVLERLLRTPPQKVKLV